MSSLVLNAQSPYFQWAKTMGGTTHDAGFSIKTDAQGNVYTIGYFEGIVDFDPGPAVYNLGTISGSHAFIQKLDSTGQLIWAKEFAGTGAGDWSNAASLTTDAFGSIYITGTFTGTVDFDPGVNTNNMTYGGVRDLFIVKLDSIGDYLWAKQVSGSNWIRPRSIKLDQQLNAYVLGNFSDSVDFDPGLNSSMQNADIGRDVFILKLDPLGNFNWVKHIGGDLNFDPASMSIDLAGMIYATGNFTDSGDFNPGVDSFKMTSFGMRDIFIIKLDSSGNFIWAKQLGGPLHETSGSLETDQQSNIYFTGKFRGVADMNPDTVLNYNLTANGSIGYSDIVILKLDSSGHFIWAKQIGGIFEENPISLTLDSFNNIYTTGFYQSSPVDFDPGPGVHNLTLNSSYDVYISKINSNGDFRWAKNIEGSSGSGSQGASIALDKKGSIYVTGVFTGLVDFDTDTATSFINGNGGWDIYIHKMSQCPPLFDTITTTACNSIVINGINYSSTGMYSQPLSSSTTCDSILILDLTINVIDTSVTQSGFTLTSNEPSANYQWINCSDSSIIIGATNQTFVVSSNISCAVIVTKNGCIDTSLCYSITGVGLTNNTVSENLFNIYPNPTSGKFDLEINNTDNKKYNFELRSIHGYTIIRKENLLSRETINISSQPTGVYLLLIENSDNVYIQKIVKE